MSLWRSSLSFLDRRCTEEPFAVFALILARANVQTFDLLVMRSA